MASQNEMPQNVRRIVIGSILAAVIVVGGIFLADRWGEYTRDNPQAPSTSK